MAIKGEYGKSENGNFEVFDVIGIPHPYMITARHVTWAADKHGGMLHKEAIESAEKAGIRCGMRGCMLTYDQHEQALLVKCHEELNGPDDKVNPELNAYLLKIKDAATENGYAGFAFVKAEQVKDDNG